MDANGPEEQVMGWYYYLNDKSDSRFRPNASFRKLSRRMDNAVRKMFSVSK